MGELLPETHLLVLLTSSIIGDPSWHLCVSHQMTYCPGGCLSLLIHLKPSTTQAESTGQGVGRGGREKGGERIEVEYVSQLL